MHVLLCVIVFNLCKSLYVCVRVCARVCVYMFVHFSVSLLVVCVLFGSVFECGKANR